LGSDAVFTSAPRWIVPLSLVIPRAEALVVGVVAREVTVLDKALLEVIAGEADLFVVAHRE
jgi:hypothetical protein